LLLVVVNRLVVELLHGAAGFLQLAADEIHLIPGTEVLGVDLIAGAGDRLIELIFGDLQGAPGGLVFGIGGAAGAAHLVEPALRILPSLVGGTQALAVVTGQQGVGQLTRLQHVLLGLVAGQGGLGSEVVGVEGAHRIALETALIVEVEQVVGVLIGGESGLFLLHPGADVAELLLHEAQLIVLFLLPGLEFVGDEGVGDGVGDGGGGIGVEGLEMDVYVVGAVGLNRLGVALDEGDQPVETGVGIGGGGHGGGGGAGAQLGGEVGILIEVGGVDGIQDDAALGDIADFGLDQGV